MRGSTAALIALALLLGAPFPAQAEGATRTFETSTKPCEKAIFLEGECAVASQGSVSVSCVAKLCSYWIAGRAIATTDAPGLHSVELTATTLILRGLSGSTQTEYVCSRYVTGDGPLECAGELSFTSDIRNSSCHALTLRAVYQNSEGIEYVEGVRVYYVCRDSAGVVSIDDSATQPPPPPAPAFQTTIPVPTNRFVAVRVNMTAGNDVVVSMRLHVVAGESGPTSTYRGDLWNGYLMMSQASTLGQPLEAQATLGNQSARTPIPLYPVLGTYTFNHGAGPFHTAQTRTFFIGQAGGDALLDVRIWATKGLDSFDIAEGALHSRRISEFEGLASTTTGKSTTALSTALKVQTSWAPPHDAMGEWIPRTWSAYGTTASSCERDGEPCPGYSGKSYLLLTGSQASWRFAIDHAIEPGQADYHALIGAEFPDGSYIN